MNTVFLQNVVRIHTGQGNDLSWSPDCRCVAVAVEDGYIGVFEAATGTGIRTFYSQAETASTVAWSPLGERLATGSDVSQAIAVWNRAVERQSECTLEYASMKGESFEGVAALCWSPDWEYLAAGMWDHTVQVWRVSTRKLSRIYRGHESFVWSVRWSPDGSTIASGSNDGSIQVWNAGSGQLLYSYRDPQSNAWGVDWSADSTRIASSWTGGHVRIHEVRSQRVLLTYAGHCQATRTRAVSWSSNGYLASGDDDGVLQVWRASTGECVLTNSISAEAIYALAWSPQGERLALTGQDGTLGIYEFREE